MVTRRLGASRRIAVVGLASVLAGMLTATGVASAATFSSQLTRYPWLTDVTPTSAAVSWASSVSSTGTVSYGPAGGSCATSTATATRVAITVNGVTESQYTAKLPGLSAATAYCYRVFVGTTTKTDLLASDASPVFRTLPSASSTAPVTFAVIGDWGDTTTNGVNPGDTTNGVNPEQANVMTQLAASGAQFIVTTADIAYQNGNDTNYGDLNQTGTNVSAVFGPTFYKKVGATIPFFATVGNHGLSKTVLQNWPESATAAASGGVYGMVDYPSILGSTPVTSPSAWYAVQAGNTRVYMLDAAWSNGNVPTGSSMYQQDYLAHWTVSSDEYKWLAADLASHPGGIKFAVFHYPLHSDNSSETSDTYLGGSDGLEGLLSRYDVAATFNGHAHVYQRNTAQPGLGRMVTYVTGGGGARLEPMPSATKCSPTDAYGIGWSYSSVSGSKCGSAVKPTSTSQVFHFLLVTVSGSTVTVRPTDSNGNVFDPQTFNFGSDTAAPSAPTGLTAAATSQTQVHLAWTAATDNVGVTSYDVLRGGTRVGSVSAPATSFDDPTASAGTTYSYTVVANDAAGNASQPSGAATVTTPGGGDSTPPAAPTGLTATASSSTAVDLSWTASTDDVGVTGYDIARGGTVIASVNGTTTTYRDTTVSAGTTYSYTVVAEDAAGNRSAASAPATVTTPASPDTTPPTTPSGLTATASSSTAVDLSWSASTDDVGVTGYEVSRGGSVVGTVSGGTTVYHDTTVSAGTTYTYTVVALDAAGNRSAASSPAAVTTPATASLFSDDFESGTLANWSTVSGLTTQQSIVDTGSWAARQTSTGSTTMAQTVIPASTSVYYKTRFYIVSRGSTSSVYFIKFRTAGSTNASILGVEVNASGKLTLRNDAGNVTLTSALVPTTGQWHSVEVHAVVNGTASSLEVWLDGVKVDALSPATTSLGTTPIGRLQLGDNSGARTYDVALDNVVAATSFIP